MIQGDDVWMKDAVCRGVNQSDDIFFPKVTKRGQKIDYKPAEALCRICPVRASCLAYSIAHDIRWGVWGGYSPYKRRRIPASIRHKISQAWWRRYPNSRRLQFSMGRR